MKPRLRLAHLAASLALLAASSLSLQAQKVAAPSAQEQRSLDQSGGPDLVSGPNGEPILRYPVAHQHAATDCVGWLYISRDTMRYEVLAPEQDKGDAFELRRSDLTVAQQWRLGGSSLPEAEFKFSDGAIYHFFHLRNRIVQTRSVRFSWGDVLSFQDLVDGVKNFDSIVATLQGGAAPPAAQAAPPPPPKPLSPPVVQITEPAGVEEGKSVEAAGNVLRGTATHGKGISAVLVNDRLASLKTLSPTTSQFESSDLSLNEGWTPLTVVARSTDGSMSWLSFKLSRPAVRWLNPLNGAVETSSAAILAQAEAVGFNGVDKVELAGNSLNLEKVAGGAVEFHTILPLVLGQNTFQGTVVGSSGFRLAFKLEVRRIAPSAQDSR